MNTLRCVMCNKYVGYTADSGTRYGCSDPEAPEPFDPDFWCKKCAIKEKDALIKRLSNPELQKDHKPYWIMPNWATEAMIECGWDCSKTPHTIERLLKVE